MSVKEFVRFPLVKAKPEATARSEATGGYVFPYSLIFTTIAVSQCQILIGQKDSSGRLGAVDVASRTLDATVDHFLALIFE